jgi:ribonuclease R
MMARTPRGTGERRETVATGRVRIHPRGFGFLELISTPPGGPEAGASVFVAPPELRGLLADDLVEARLAQDPDDPGRRWSARGLRLVERTRRLVFGETVRQGGRTWLRIDPEVANSDWPLAPLAPGGQAPGEGDAVLARPGDGGVAVLVRTLPADSDQAWYRILVRHDLPGDFSAQAMDEARRAARQAHRVGARRDLRDVPTMTVDAPATRDIDDAVSVLPAAADGALRLLVSIADVAVLVGEGSELDREARARATSVYLPDRVLPMLPDELSTDRASLLPGQDRCCITVELRIEPEGSVTAVDVYESVIRSAARVTYDDVALFLDRQEVAGGLAALARELPLFRAAAARLGVARARRGGIQFARDEARITFDPATGDVAGLEAERTTSAHRLIERFMVAANEAIAGWLHARGVPALFRVHDAPSAERTADLEAISRNFGFEAGFGGRMSPLSLAVLDGQIAGTPCESALRQVMLRALGPARYTVSPLPHFGLAAPLYLHFTSPIRRYADLAVHRAVKAYLRGTRPADPRDPDLERLGGHLNARSRAASRAEADRHRVLAARVLASRPAGETYGGRITRVRSTGAHVQLDASLAEGVIPAEALPGGPYRLDEREIALAGRSRSFVIGMPVRVRVALADRSTGRVELALAEAPAPRQSRTVARTGAPRGTRSG